MRRPFDAYFTPSSAVETLLKHVSIEGRVLECCSGDGAIARPLKSHGCQVDTNDFNFEMPAALCFDATDPCEWRFVTHDWVVSNPPFKGASQIVPLAFNAAKIGVAMLLRLSFLEPCEDRADFLSQHPPTQLIVLPRISFTGDGKTDSVTCAWMVWNKHQAGTRIVIERKPQRVRETVTA